MGSSLSSNPLLQNHDRDIIRVAILLSRKLPADLVPIVLDYAQKWTTFAVAETDQQRSASEYNPCILVLQCMIPKGILEGYVRRVRFTIKSRDQGWSSYPQDHGTYNNSWTWYDAGIFRSQIRMMGSEEEIVDEEVARKIIVTNLHAYQQWTTHEVFWDHDSEDGFACSVVNGMRGGDRIEVSMWAKYPGWTNNLKYMRIEVDGVYVRKM